MSGVVKGIGKVFKKIVKVAKVVLPIALAVGAVVFTGGAALGILPTFSAAIGGVVTSLGIGGAVAGALTGAVVSAGFGSAIGGLTSAAQGKSIIKGMQTGALTGAVTGGVLGAISPATFGIVRGADGAWTTANAIRTGSTFGAAGSGNQIARGADGLYSRVGDAANSGGTPPGFGSTSAPAPAGGTPPGFGDPATTGNFQSLVDQPGALRSVDPSAALTGKGLNAGGAVSPISDPNSTFSQSIFGTGSPAATATSPATVPPGMSAAPIAGQAVSAPPTGALVAGQAAPAAGGIGGFLNNNPLLAGSVLQSVGGFLGGSEAQDTVEARAEAERQAAIDAYGGVYTRDNPFGTRAYAPPPRRYFYNTTTNTVEEVPI